MRGRPGLDRIENRVANGTPCDVLEAQHYSSIAAGGADAPVQPPSTSLATDAVSSAAFPPALSDAAAGHPGQGDSPAGPDCSACRSISGASPTRRWRRIMSDKIRPQHVARKAILYVRQSTSVHWHGIELES
jgi:hypothetical protein